MTSIFRIPVISLPLPEFYGASPVVKFKARNGIYYQLIEAVYNDGYRKERDIKVLAPVYKVNDKEIKLVSTAPEFISAYDRKNNVFLVPEKGLRMFARPPRDIERARLDAEGYQRLVEDRIYPIDIFTGVSSFKRVIPEDMAVTSYFGNSRRLDVISEFFWLRKIIGSSYIVRFTLERKKWVSVTINPEDKVKWKIPKRARYFIDVKEETRNGLKDVDPLEFAEKLWEKKVKIHYHY